MSSETVGDAAAVTALQKTIKNEPEPQTIQISSMFSETVGDAEALSALQKTKSESEPEKIIKSEPETPQISPTNNLPINTHDQRKTQRKPKKRRKINKWNVEVEMFYGNGKKRIVSSYPVKVPGRNPSVGTVKLVRQDKTVNTAK